VLATSITDGTQTYSVAFSGALVGQISSSIPGDDHVCSLERGALYIELRSKSGQSLVIVFSMFRPGTFTFDSSSRSGKPLPIITMTDGSSTHPKAWKRDHQSGKGQVVLFGGDGNRIVGTVNADLASQDQLGASITHVAAAFSCTI